MSFKDDDFDEDLDDILMSDDETTKKSKRNIIKTKNDLDVPKDIPPESGKQILNGNISQFYSNKSNKSPLFEDDHDPLATIDIPKSQSKQSQEQKKKGAKSVLDSLLSPVSELDDFSFNKINQKPKESNITAANSGITNEKKQTAEDDFWKTSNYRPSTEGPQMKSNNESNGNKRTVRFSADANLDNGLDSTDSGRTRPVTAPSTAIEVAKSRFVSRFEEAEYDHVLPKHNDTKLNSESDPTLWRATTSDDFVSSSGSGSKLKISDEDIEYKKNDGNTRLNPKQKLSEFLQNSTEDIFARPTNTANSSTIEQITIDEFTFPAKPVKSNEHFSPRRSSVQPDISSERPKTGYGRSEFRRRSSIQVDSSYERPRSEYGHQDDDDLDSKYGPRSNVTQDTFFERPRTGHNRMDISPHRPGTSRSDVSDMELQLKQIQGQRDDLAYKLEGIVKRNKEEMEIQEKSYKNRIELMEENIQRKERRFKEEIEMLTQQNRQKLQMLEDERMEMRSELSRRQDELEDQKRNEISRIREQHKLEVDKLRNNHEDLIEKLRYAKIEEDSTIKLAQPTTAQLQSVLAQVSVGAHDLASLKEQFLDQMNRQMKEKDIELKLKNDSMRQLEEQLHCQKDDNFKERERLQSLIAKLDIQLKDQMKQADEERWYLRQEQNKLAALQSSLDKEREHLLMEKDQNRATYEEFRVKLLEEQKQLFDKVYEEKRALAEERAKLTREVSKWSESSQFTNMKKNQESAELEGIRSALTDERRDIESMRDQISKEREENIQKLSQINSLNYDLKLKTEKLHQMEAEVASKQRAIDDKERNCLQLDSKAEESLRKAKAIQNSQQEQISKIQKQLIILAEKEKQINKEQMELEKCRSTFVKPDKSSTCPRCSNMLRDSALGGSLNNINAGSVSGIPRPPVSRKYDSYYDADVADSIEYSHQISGKIEEERLIHSIRRAADEDRDYLENERAYLRSLKMSADQCARKQVWS